MRKLLLVAFLALAGTPALAVDVTAVWVEQLTLEGYEKITVRRTWLGRVRIIAERGEIEREIVLNPRTGEVLRDYSRAEDGNLRLPLGFGVELGHDDDDEEDDHEGPEDAEDEKDEADDGGNDDEGDDEEDDDQGDDEGDDDDGDNDDGDDDDD